uniref:Uncharacterized protein n=1 Tax=Anguilla anguilla TaxID=7936 RepID=A0A0E9SUJ5_ANGAN
MVTDLFRFKFNQREVVSQTFY